MKASRLFATLVGIVIAVTSVAQTDSIMDKRHRNIAAVASLTAKGDIEQLKMALATSHDEGMTVKEVIVHSYAYCSFPRAIRGLQTLVGVLDERKAQGITDDYGREASPIESEGSKYERGRNILAELSGVPKDAPKPAYAQLSPKIERFLKEHLFCDLFERDVLTYQEREIATVAVINALSKGVEPMLRSHIAVALRIGVKPETLCYVFSAVEKYRGKSEADTGRRMLRDVLTKENKKSGKQ